MISDAPQTAPHRALLFIFVTVTINSMGIGLIMPVMPDLLLSLTGDFGEMSIGEAAAWGGWLTLSYAAMQFLISPTLGNLSDAYGRRPVLLLSLFVMGIDYLIMAITPSLALLFVARMMAGAASATFSTANAYIADISTPEKRAQNFGVTGAAFGVGFVLGPVVGGLVGEFGPRMPFYAAAVLTFANLLFGYFALPESLRPEKRRPFQIARANSLGVALQMLKYPAVAWMLAAMFIYNIAHYVYPVVWSYYAKVQFEWTPFDIGLSLACVGIGYAVVQGFLIKYILAWLGAAKTALVGLCLDVAALIGIALSTEGWMVYALVPLTSLSALVAPAMQGLMSNKIPDDTQGELQGAISALSSLSFMITPVLMSQLFFYFTSSASSIYFPGAPFIAAAIFSALAILPLLRGLRAQNADLQSDSRMP
jgi:DHA1 family tetracycline resistance protein-like MFS transporter